MLISILGAIALNRGIEGGESLALSSGFVLSFEAIALPSIFFITAFRFLPGNLAHLGELGETEGTTPYIWLYDLAVIMIESLLCIPMAKLSYSNGRGFFVLLVILLMLDGLWILTMIPQWKKGQRPEPPVYWAVLNVGSAFLLVSSLLVHLPFDALSLPGLLMFTLVFWIVGLTDIVKSAKKWFG